jgi:glycosyltransferase involved in cell wall biosynthesis
MVTPFPIAHLTSVHPRDDTRIFHKECKSLAKAGYRVTLIVADGKGDANVDDISIRDVDKSATRLGRMVSSTRRIYDTAQELDAEVFHFHDPELVPVGLALKRLGRKVIFDSHEDVAKQIKAKPYIPKFARSAVSSLYSLLESRASKHFDAVVCATPSIAETFAEYGAETTVVANYPIIGELVSVKNGSDGKLNTVCYVGGLSDVRGIREVVKAAASSCAGVQLKFAGRFASSSFEREIMALPESGKALFLGWLDRADIAKLFGESIAGLVTLHETPNHIESLPIKMFEYMSAGLPVIASDFPLWRKIVSEADCGICVDPTDVRAIADAMDELVDNRQRAVEMGRNGQVAVKQKYNWATQAEKLLALYERLVGSTLSGGLTTTLLPVKAWHGEAAPQFRTVR